MNFVQICNLIIDGIRRLLPANWADSLFLSRTVSQWLAAVLITALAFFLRRLFARIIIFILANLRWQNEKLGAKSFQRLHKSLQWLLPLLAFRFALIQILEISAESGKAVDILLQFLFIIILLLFCDALLQILLGWLQTKNPGKLTDTVYLFYQQIIRIFLIALGIIMSLSLFGFNVTGIVTGLGIGGLAISLAAKESLTNLFAGITIISDQMFELGDLVKGPDFVGVVEFIGLRSSRLRSHEQTVFIVPNSKLTDNVLENLNKMKKRRLRLQFIFPLDAETEKIKLISSELGQYLDSRPNKTPDPYYLGLESVAEKGISLLLQYYISDLAFPSFIAERDALINFFLELLERNNLKLSASQIKILTNDDIIPADKDNKN